MWVGSQPRYNAPSSASFVVFPFHSKCLSGHPPFPTGQQIWSRFLPSYYLASVVSANFNKIDILIVCAATKRWKRRKSETSNLKVDIYRKSDRNVSRKIERKRNFILRYIGWNLTHDYFRLKVSRPLRRRVTGLQQRWSHLGELQITILQGRDPYIRYYTCFNISATHARFLHKRYK